MLLIHQHRDELPEQHQRQQSGNYPELWPQPGFLFVLSGLAQVEHHHHEQEQHHDGPGIDDGLEHRDEGGAQHEEDHRHGQQREDQVDKRVHNVSAGDHGESGYQRDCPGKIEEQHHGSRLLTSTGGDSLSASPLSFPLMALPATR